MLRKIIFVIFGFTLLLIVYFSFLVSEYLYKQHQNEKMISFCAENNTEDCKARMIELLIPHILVHKAKINKKELDLIRLDCSRIDSKYALEIADASFGYGIFNSAAFEENFASTFNKNSYAFDCGVHSFKTEHPKCLFFSECIATDKYLIFDHLYTKKMQTSSNKVHSLSQKIQELNLSNKKIFVKMDIGKATYEVIPELIKHSDNISGLNIGIGFHSTQDIIKLTALLKELNKKFILIHCNTAILETNIEYSIVKSKYYKGVLNSEFMYFSYINKDLVDNYNVRICQNTDKIYKNKKIEKLGNNKLIPVHDISVIAIIGEKIKKFLKESTNRYEI